MASKRKSRTPKIFDAHKELRVDFAQDVSDHATELL